MTHQSQKPQPIEISEKIRDLLPGDTAFVLSGTRTTAKEVEVISAQDGIIKARFEDERGEFVYEFNAEDGLALIEAVEGKGIPVLTITEDPRVAIIQQRAQHKRYRVELEPLANAFTQDPTLDNYDALAQFLIEWGTHSLGMDLITTIAAQVKERGHRRPEPSTDPKSVECPACMARVGNPCTRPTEKSRVPVNWFHSSREHRVEELQRDLTTDPVVQQHNANVGRSVQFRPPGF